MQKMTTVALMLVLLLSCGAGKHKEADSTMEVSAVDVDLKFSADSAYSYIKRQVDFGPRVPNTPEHDACGRWLVAELRRHGAEVTEQKTVVQAFDGNMLSTTNIIGQFNPGAKKRTLLLAHWDTRPWADKDPDPAKRKRAIDGANDGASGVGVLLEIARVLGLHGTDKGIDILFVDAEDWGSEDKEDSWALGAQYFVTHPFKGGYYPDEAILLDMVGGEGATFCREYFSEQSAPHLAAKIWAIAKASGFGEYFPDKLGSAVTDDHVQFINAGVPAIDIIDYREGSGFHPSWHTTGDNMQVIDRKTLNAVGQTVLNYLALPEE